MAMTMVAVFAQMSVMCSQIKSLQDFLFYSELTIPNG